ncbi:TetR/AcrR family transcriptional regulator [Streptomyces sp. NPDC055094]
MTTLLTSFIRSFDSNERIVRTYGPIRHPAQILGATEHLFAERGYRSTSVRAITDLAGANPAGVGYREAFAGPLFGEMPGGDEGGARTFRLIVTIVSDPAEEMRDWAGPAEDTVRDRYLAAFARTARPFPGGTVVPDAGDPRRDGRGPRRGLQRIPVYNRYPRRACPR